MLLLCTLISVLTTSAIIVVLAPSPALLPRGPALEFLFGTRWTPLLEPRSFGVLPLVGGTS